VEPFFLSAEQCRYSTKFFRARGPSTIVAEMLTRQHGDDRLRQAIEKALATGCTDPAAVRHLLHAGELKHTICEVIDVGLLERYERSLPVMNEYDRLLMAGGAQ
jgi:hypothetical protein